MLELPDASALGKLAATPAPRTAAAEETPEQAGRRPEKALRLGTGYQEDPVMEQPYVKIRTTDPDGTTANITELCRSITWSGDWRGISRTLTFPRRRSAGTGICPRRPRSWAGRRSSGMGTLLMDAFSLERSRDSLGATVDVTAYDRGIYLKRNSKYMRVERQTPETVTAALCGEFGIETGELAATGVTLTRNFLGVNLYKIIMTLYTLAADQTGKKYRVRSGEKLEVVEMQKTAETILLEAGEQSAQLHHEGERQRHDQLGGPSMTTSSTAFRWWRTGRRSGLRSDAGGDQGQRL